MTARGKAGMKPLICGWSLGQDWEQEAKTKLASVGPVTLRVDGHWVVGLGTPGLASGKGQQVGLPISGWTRLG